jgi:hypothetical protein
VCRRQIVVAVALVIATGCTATHPPSDPSVRLLESSESGKLAIVVVEGADRQSIMAARRLGPTSDEWRRMFDVRVIDANGTASATPVAGTYTVADDVLQFTPMFPFDPGRRYEARYNPSGFESDARTVRAIVARRAAPAPPPTYVTHVFPSADVLPENQLRMYIHFSAPMGRRGGLDHVKLLDEKGKEVVDPFLPLDAEFWNDDRTRYTLFFDPGRQKRGILPNRQMGPSLVAGHGYTLVIDRAWIDGNGNPLRETFERKFRVGEPSLRAIDYRTWRVTAPASGTRNPLTVAFPEPLDHGLLMRAVGVRRDGQPVTGEIRVDANERRWILTPAAAWTPGRYELIALSILEDLAGNRIGRAFEIETFDRLDEDDTDGEPATTRIPFELLR